MGLVTKTDWLIDRQSQCDFDFDFDQEKKKIHKVGLWGFQVWFEDFIYVQYLEWYEVLVPVF
jgi:hypothetical protein